MYKVVEHRMTTLMRGRVTANALETRINENAVDYRERHGRPAIISEDHWASEL